MAGNIFGVDIGPAALNSLVAAVVFAVGIRARVPLNDIFQAEPNFSSGCDQSQIAGAEQPIFSKTFEMVMVVARVVVEERVGGWIAHDQIGGADVSGLSVEHQEPAYTGNGATFVNRAIIRCEGPVDHVRSSGRSVNHQIGVSARRFSVAKRLAKAKK